MENFKRVTPVQSINFSFYRENNSDMKNGTLNSNNKQFKNKISDILNEKTEGNDKVKKLVKI